MSKSLKDKKDVGKGTEGAGPSLADKFMEKAGSLTDKEVYRLGYDYGAKAAREHPECAGSAEFFNDHFVETYGFRAMFDSICGVDSHALAESLRPSGHTGIADLLRAIVVAEAIRTVGDILKPAFLEGIQAVVPLRNKKGEKS